MKLHCEIVAQNVLPAVRALVARELIKEYKLNQIEVSRILHITQAAVSQYLRKIRGSDRKIINNELVSKEIKSLCTRIYSREIDESQLAAEFFKVCNVITANNLVSGLTENYYQVEHCEFCQGTGIKPNGT